MVVLFGFDTYVAWSDLAMTGYLVINLLLLFLLMLCTCRCKTPCKDWRSKLWERRSIYSPLILQFLDQTTDIGVVILWIQLALKEKNDDEFEVAHVNVTLFAGISIIAFLVYRIAIIIAACIADNYDNRRCFPVFLSFFDLIFIYEIYFVHSHDLPELSEDMRNYQLLQCICESVPQVVFQSVFLLRTWPNRFEFGEDFSELYARHEYLLLVSIVISVINIVNKYTWRDQHNAWVENKCKLFGGVARYWFLHVLWRSVHVLARIVLIVLMWSVLGGLLLSVFWLLAFIIFMIVYDKHEFDRSIIKTYEGRDATFKDVFISGFKVFVFEHVIGMTGEETPSSKILGFRMLLRLFEAIIGISLIWVFVQYANVLTCPKYICSDVENRDWDVNEMIKIYFFCLLAAVFLDFVLFIFMYSLDLLQVNNGKKRTATIEAPPAADTEAISAQTSMAPEDPNGSNGAITRPGVGTGGTGAGMSFNYKAGGGNQYANDYRNTYSGLIGHQMNQMEMGYGGNMVQMQQMGRMEEEFDEHEDVGDEKDEEYVTQGGPNSNQNENENENESNTNSNNSENENEKEKENNGMDESEDLPNEDLTDPNPREDIDMPRNVSNETLSAQRVASVDEP